MATQDTAIAPKEERTVSLQRSLYDPGYVNAMSHFYRGELGRIMVWRQRLDMTTNWAITSSTAIITIAFSTRAVPHIIFFFNLAIVAVLLWIESRRYRFYDAFRARNRRITCCSISRSASAIGMGAGEIYWIMRQTKLSS